MVDFLKGKGFTVQTPPKLVQNAKFEVQTQVRLVTARKQIQHE